VQDLEVMLDNVLQLALDHASSLPAMLELLQGFQQMAQREALRGAVQRHMSHCCGEFMAEVNAIKKHLDVVRRSPPSSPVLPRHAGAARWVLAVPAHQHMGPFAGSCSGWCGHSCLVCKALVCNMWLN
jgi:dynein heavy chain